jgi:hypothetical protein
MVKKKYLLKRLFFRFCKTENFARTTANFLLFKVLQNILR